MLRPIQDRIYKNIYVFSDNEDEMEDIEKRYKYLGNGFKSFTRQRKRLTTGNAASEFIES